MYKNYDDSVYGLDQYRRAFDLSEEQIYDKLTQYDIIIHQTDVEQHTRLWHLERGFGLGGLLNETRQLYAVMRYLTPDFAKSYIDVLNSKQSCQHNMFICSKKIFKEYCDWLFTTLKLYKDSYGVTNTPNRSIGHIAELTCLSTFINCRKLKAYNAQVITGK